MEERLVTIPMNYVCISIDELVHLRMKVRDLTEQNETLLVNNGKLTGQVKALEEKVEKLQSDLEMEKDSSAFWYKKCKVLEDEIQTADMKTDA